MGNKENVWNYITKKGVQINISACYKINRVVYFNSCLRLDMYLSPSAVKHELKQFDAGFIILFYLHRPNLIDC